MALLELRFQTLAEARQFTNRKRTGDVSKALTVLGYGFEYVKNKGQIIKELPPKNSTEVLKSILINRLQLDSRTNIKAFAGFFILLLDDEDFRSMPMQVRLNKLQDYCGVSVSTATLYNYLKKLTNLNYIITEKNDKYWYTTYKNKRKIQKSVENAEMENLCNKWLQDKKKYTNLGLSLNTIYSQLWLDYGYYFYCPNKITLNGFSIEETSELIETCYLIIGGVSV